MIPTRDTLMQVCEATWPPARRVEDGPFTLRDGAGGGKRASAATLNGTAMPDAADLQRAEEHMRAMGQAPLFQIRAGEEAFDRLLAAAGYDILDPVNLFAIEAQRLTDTPIPRLTTFCSWEPLAIMLDLWAAGGIGPERVAVMHRAPDPKTGILGRMEDSPAATAFVSVSGGVAMVHALEVTAEKRRKGMARWIMRAAGFWAVAQGAGHVAVACLRDNAAANGLYRAMGFAPAGAYHYRIKRG